MTLKHRLGRLDGRLPLTWEVWRQLDVDLYGGPNGETKSTAQLERYKRKTTPMVGLIVVRRE